MKKHEKLERENRKLKRKLRAAEAQISIQAWAIENRDRRIKEYIRGRA